MTVQTKKWFILTVCPIPGILYIIINFVLYRFKFIYLDNFQQCLHIQWWWDFFCVCTAFTNLRWIQCMTNKHNQNVEILTSVKVTILLSCCSLILNNAQLYGCPCIIRCLLFVCVRARVFIYYIRVCVCMRKNMPSYVLHRLELSCGYEFSSSIEQMIAYIFIICIYGKKTLIIAPIQF